MFTAILGFGCAALLDSGQQLAGLVPADHVTASRDPCSMTSPDSQRAFLERGSLRVHQRRAQLHPWLLH